MPGVNLCSAWATRDQLKDLPTDFQWAPDELDAALLNASGILARLTGSRWPGSCRDVIRPQGSGGCGCHRERTRTGCHWLSELELPGFPVLSIVEVLLNGDLVSEDHYRVDDARWLVYLPGDDEPRRGWPCCQRMDRTTDQDETWEVTYTWGGTPDAQGVPGGTAAALALTKELLLAGKAGKACRLPARVQNVTRQGVSYLLLDDLSMFSEGRTGLPEVDLWLASLQLGRARRRSAVIDPHAIAMAGRRVRRTDWNPSS